MRGEIPPSCIQCGGWMIHLSWTGISRFIVPYDPFSIQTSSGRLRRNRGGGMGLLSLGVEHLRFSVARWVPASVCCHRSPGPVSPRAWPPAVPPASHRVSLRVQVKPVAPGGCSEPPAGQGMDGRRVSLGLGLLRDRDVPILLHGQRASPR